MTSDLPRATLPISRQARIGPIQLDSRASFRTVTQGLGPYVTRSKKVRVLDTPVQEDCAAFGPGCGPCVI